MKTAQFLWNEQPSEGRPSTPPLRDANLLLVFGAGERLADATWYGELRRWYPKAHIVSCSTAGEIKGTQVLEGTLTVTAVALEHSQVRTAQVRLEDGEDSRQAGVDLVRCLDQDGLKHVVVISDGLRINGSELSDGLRAALPQGVAATGGLSGDGARFQRTVVGLNEAPTQGTIAAIGFYGDRLKVGYGSLGGWDPFGPERVITRSQGNVLYELDGRSALDLYKTYLGEHAAGLPATGLLFPLAVRPSNDGTSVVRTILAVSEANQSMTFAGDLPEGWNARLMKANFDRLIDGAVGAARGSAVALAGSSPELALLVSCVGRRLILKQRVEEEVEGVRDVLGGCTTLAGFYSYGEICPQGASSTCELHNQTMTITTFAEA